MLAVIREARARRKRVLAMRKKGMTFHQIAAELGVSYQRAQALHSAAMKDAAAKAIA